MKAPLRLPREALVESFTLFRNCGRGRRECQVLWVGPWDTPNTITHIVHPRHVAHGGGFQLDDAWLSQFWVDLGDRNMGIRIQVHTHPREAFHSFIDDQFPIIHKPGFLSLVIPNFGLGRIGFGDAYLTEIQVDGSWKEAMIHSRLIVI